MGNQQNQVCLFFNLCLSLIVSFLVALFAPQDELCLTIGLDGLRALANLLLEMMWIRIPTESIQQLTRNARCALLLGYSSLSE